MKRVLKPWVYTTLLLISCCTSIIIVGCVEADNYYLAVPCLVLQLLILLTICKYEVK